MADLAQVVVEGGRAVVIIVVQMAADRFDGPAIDSAFDRSFPSARDAGVEVHAHRCRATETEVAIAEEIPVGGS